jgi:signal transduction histidine kinase
MHAIYETGSRLTHDVKNLLQSLGSLCSAVETSDERDAAAVRRLVQRQLPQITQRLQGTLDKLTHTQSGRHEIAAAVDWWREVQQRYGHEGILFDAIALPAAADLPVELFDSVADNFLQNALAKRRSHRAIRIRATLAWESGCSLTVCDSGDPMNAEVAEHLFAAPVPSLHGLGVGLYQSARQAAAAGYRLTLASNVKGKVCFGLLPVASKESLMEASPRPPSD